MIMYKCPYYKMDVVFMTIPEVRAELERLAEKYGIPRLGELAEALYRSPPVSRAKPTSQPKTPELGKKIRAYKADHPHLKQREIAQVFNVDGGRVSEALNNKF